MNDFNHAGPPVLYSFTLTATKAGVSDIEGAHMGIKGEKEAQNDRMGRVGPPAKSQTIFF